MELPAEAIESVLARWPVADLATPGADGRPHVVPVVFAHRDGDLWSPIDGKPKSGRELVRVRNLRRDPRVALLLHHYDADWRKLWWLRVEGSAEVRTLASPPDEADTRALAALREKYPQYAETPLPGAGGTLLRIRIEALRSWRASGEVVEPSGIEPPTSALRTQRSPS